MAGESQQGGLQLYQGPAVQSKGGVARVVHWVPSSLKQTYMRPGSCSSNTMHAAHDIRVAGQKRTD